MTNEKPKHKPREKRKRAAKILRESEDRFRRLTDHAMDAFILHNLEGRIVEVNRCACDSLGYTRDELISKTIADIEMNFESLKLADGWKRLVPGAPVTLNGVHRRKDGTTFPVEVRVGLFDFGGRQYVLALARDISERRNLEEQLRQSQKMEAIGSLVGGVAHDFNNLLMVIRGYSELLSNNIDPRDSRHSQVTEIQRTADRGALLTKQLLAFGRRQVIEPQILDLNAIVGDMEEMLRRLIGEDIELLIRAPEDATRCKADRGQLEQVILNLAVNARDSMPQGGNLTLEATDIDLDETYFNHHPEVPSGRYVMLAVSDTGTGMDKDTQSRVFEPFFTTKEKTRGTGLGLSIVYGIVKQNEGHIWVYSEPEKGTTFKIYLPRVVETAEAIAEDQPLQKPPLGTETVLLAEDDESVRKLASTLLRTLGYTVLESKDCTEAFETCERQKSPIHLLVTDIVMPRMSGPELAKRLTSFHPELKVLYMSGYTGDALSQHGLGSRDAFLLEKPFSMGNLARKVREVLEAEQRGGIGMAGVGPAEQPGRRRYRRYNTNIPASITTDKGKSQTNIIQISRGGCLVFPPKIQFSDPNVNLTFQLVERLPSFRTAGRIIYTIHNRGCGIVFSGFSEMERDGIEGFFSNPISG